MPATEIRHPLIQHKMGLLRRHDLPLREVRRLVADITVMLIYEASRNLPLEAGREIGWNGEQAVERLAGQQPTLVPILRAGLGMLDGALQLLPDAPVSTIGMLRDEKSLQARAYLERLAPNLEQRAALILDPMLATGSSMIASLDLLKAAGCQNISVLVLVAAPEGINALQKAHPDVRLLTAAIDKELDEQGYILPGLGDAGDRLFGTC